MAPRAYIRWVHGQSSESTCKMQRNKGTLISRPRAPGKWLPRLHNRAPSRPSNPCGPLVKGRHSLQDLRRRSDPMRTPSTGPKATWRSLERSDDPRNAENFGLDPRGTHTVLPTTTTPLPLHHACLQWFLPCLCSLVYAYHTGYYATLSLTKLKKYTQL